MPTTTLTLADYGAALAAPPALSAELQRLAPAGAMVSFLLPEVGPSTSLPGMSWPVLSCCVLLYLAGVR